jgi:hypothetical protein
MSNVVNLKQSLFPLVEAFFTEEEFNPQQHEDEPVFVMFVRGENARWRCFAEVNENQHRFRFLSVLDVEVPEDKRAKMAEFITRANYGLPAATFEMDFSDGELRCRSSLDLTDVRATKVMIRNVVYPNLLALDLYYTGLMGVLYSDETPEALIAKVEGESAESV